MATIIATPAPSTLPGTLISTTFIVGTAYNNAIVNLQASFGNISAVSATFEIPAPPGLTLNPSPPSGSPGPINIIINGTPTTAGTYSFRVNTNPGITPPNAIYYRINIVLPCIAYNTKILMANKTEHNIQNLERGMVVAGDADLTTTYKIARVLKNKLYPDFEIGISSFDKNSIGNNIPNRKLLITNGHPIYFESTRRAAKLFSNIDGIKSYDKIKAGDILPKEDDNDLHYLWDLQFETIGSYVANGLKIQSRHPQSFITPLPKELYFDENLYNSCTKNDHDPEYDCPLIYEPLNIIKN